MTEVIVNPPSPWGYAQAAAGPALPMPQAVSYDAQYDAQYDTPPPPMPSAPEPTALVPIPVPAPVSPAPVSPGPEPSAPAEGAEGPADAPAEVAAGPLTTSGRVAVQVVDRLRTNAERGTTTVPNMVIEKIITMSAREVPGVYAFGGTGDGGERPVMITLEGRTATVRIRLVIEYGFAVHTVTEKVRTKVISALENLFGLDVTAVDLVVEDIHVPDEDAGAEE
jgi:uncharacterized alkaline shock family protein YloU